VAIEDVNIMSVQERGAPQRNGLEKEIGTMAYHDQGGSFVSASLPSNDLVRTKSGPASSICSWLDESGIRPQNGFIQPPNSSRYFGRWPEISDHRRIRYLNVVIRPIDSKSI
jgi:hypothetical protein